MKAPGLFCILAAALGAAACAGSAGGTRGSGYGPYPDNAERVIARAAGVSQVSVLEEPDAYYLREDGDWFYGWRICVKIGADQRPAFYLLRGERVAAHFISDGNPESPASLRVYRYCGSHLDDRERS